MQAQCNILEENVLVKNSILYFVGNNLWQHYICIIFIHYMNTEQSNKYHRQNVNLIQFLILVHISTLWFFIILAKHAVTNTIPIKISDRNTAIDWLHVTHYKWKKWIQIQINNCSASQRHLLHVIVQEDVVRVVDFRWHERRSGREKLESHEHKGA